VSQLSLLDTLGSEAASFVVMGELDGSRHYDALDSLCSP
jgi:hypothetical protein